MGVGIEWLTKEKYIQWKKEGLTDIEIMKVIRTNNKTLVRWKKTQGIPRKLKRIDYVLTLDEFWKWRNEGYSYDQIARIFKISPPGLIAWVKRNV